MRLLYIVLLGAFGIRFFEFLFFRSMRVRQESVTLWLIDVERRAGSLTANGIVQVMRLWGC